MSNAVCMSHCGQSRAAHLGHLEEHWLGHLCGERHADGYIPRADRGCASPALAEVLSLFDWGFLGRKRLPPPIAIDEDIGETYGAHWGVVIVCLGVDAAHESNIAMHPDVSEGQMQGGRRPLRQRIKGRLAIGGVAPPCRICKFLRQSAAQAADVALLQRQDPISLRGPQCRGRFRLSRAAALRSGEEKKFNSDHFTASVPCQTDTDFSAIRTALVPPKANELDIAIRSEG